MPNLILGSRGTRVTFEPSGGDVALTLTSLGAGAGRISAPFDKGAGSQEVVQVGALRTQFASLPTAGQIVRVYLVEQLEFRVGGTPAFKVPGDLPATDSAIADENRFIFAGAKMIGRLIVPPSPAADTEYVSEIMEWESRARKYQIGVWNASVALTATAGHHEFATEPVDNEIQ